MRAFGVAIAQVIIALLAAGMIMPAILVSVPTARELGPVVLLVLFAVLFVLVRLAWPPPKRST